VKLGSTAGSVVEESSFAWCWRKEVPAARCGAVPGDEWHRPGSRHCI